ncbi:hypothetical protein GOP47_0004011 [Adiantum capillus-veneris]|uniref:Uncharacterized protein n=1 Tax=Adiantum capillus-veneris TaxID=13818 RepID=A0A9D4ZM70_ADICA|nr:hypothetical protein GOP47_0004011 [Adiantum capillus-veneris]
MELSPALREQQQLLRGLQQQIHAYQEGEHDELITESVQEDNLPPLGRVLSVLLSAKPQDFQTSTSLRDPARSNGFISRALAALQQHAKIELKKVSHVQKLLVPLLEHVVKSRDRNNRKQVTSIINWLSRDEYVGFCLLDGLVGILESSLGNSRIQLGWCLVVRDLLQQRVQADEFSNGTQDIALVALIKCISNLFLIVESSPKDMPTRLSVMASDCIILISKYTGDNPAVAPISELKSSMSNNEVGTSTSNSSSLFRAYEKCPENFLEASTSARTGVLAKEELLWEHLDTLLKFVLRLRKWNEDSRPLYAKGLQQIAKCLDNLAKFRDTLTAQGRDGEDLAVLMAVLSSCWDRYGLLMLVDSSLVQMDPKAELQNWVEGLQHSLHAEGEETGGGMSTRRVEEIRVFFLTCLVLLIGRLSPQDLECILQDYGSTLLQALFGQLQTKHEDVLDLAIAILRALLFQSEFFNGGTLKMDTVAPLLMDLLDERDSTSKAVVGFVADYFAINPRAPEMERLFGLLGSDNLAQRQNALGVLSELLNVLSSSDHDTTNAVRQCVAVHLLKRLGDTELANRVEVSQLLSKLDPEFVLPALIQHVYSRDEKVRSAASAAIISLLKDHGDTCVVLCVLLDSTRNMLQKTQLPMHPGQIGVSNKELSSPDVDRILRLIPSWACEVQKWEEIIDVVLRKMFSEPSNPVLPRFLSQICTQLLNNTSSVFRHVFLFMARQTRLSEDLIEKEDKELQERLNSSIFERLSPLLVLKVLPLAAFDGSCKELYGSSWETGKGFSSKEPCIASFLLDRGCGEYEAHEVRKLSAELLGRCNPNIILPLLKEKLGYATERHFFLEIKSYLFSLCNLVLLRGETALDNPCMPVIQQLLSQILMWPCSPTDEDTYNVQHGCIDCLALMVVAEMASSCYNDGIIEEQHSSQNIIEEIETETNKREEVKSSLQKSVLYRVVSSINDRYQANPFLLEQSWHQNISEPATRMLREKELNIHNAFRVCMANVLIRATQQVASKYRPLFLTQVIPHILGFIQVGKESRLRSACLQLLFSFVHNFKEQVLPYAVDLFNLSLQIMRSKASSEVL